MRLILAALTLTLCFEGFSSSCEIEPRRLTYHNLWHSVCGSCESSAFSAVCGYTEPDGWIRPVHGYYLMRHLKVGVEIRNISLWEDHPQDVIDQIKRDLVRHSLLVFREQGVLTGERQVTITSWFGQPGVAPINHAQSPHAGIWRLSNRPEQGSVNVGISGWHTDGTFTEKPFPYVFYHMTNVIDKGNTLFLSWTKVVEGLNETMRAKWEHMWMTRNFADIYPAIYDHPTTNKPVFHIHTGVTRGFIVDYGSPDQFTISPEQTKMMCRELDDEIDRNNETYIYQHKWHIGDFIMSDNLAIGHRGVSFKTEGDELRVLHRSHVVGSVKPAKNYQDLVPLDRDNLIIKI